jgi:hypothetical protein
MERRCGSLALGRWRGSCASVVSVVSRACSGPLCPAVLIPTLGQVGKPSGDSGGSACPLDGHYTRRRQRGRRFSGTFQRERSGPVGHAGDRLRCDVLCCAVLCCAGGVRCAGRLGAECIGGRVGGAVADVDGGLRDVGVTSREDVAASIMGQLERAAWELPRVSTVSWRRAGRPLAPSARRVACPALDLGTSTVDIAVVGTSGERWSGLDLRAGKSRVDVDDEAARVAGERLEVRESAGRGALGYGGSGAGRELQRTGRGGYGGGC